MVKKYYILAHGIQASEIFLPRLSQVGCSLVVLELTHIVVNYCDCYDKVKSSCNVTLQRI